MREKIKDNMSEKLNELRELLREEKCSCVIWSHGEITICRERGVKDLLSLLKEKPYLLKDALLADKVVGKGAAALMAVGGVRGVYAETVSEPALELLNHHRIATTYGRMVKNIINRAGTGVCPVETICNDVTTAEECIPLIEDFIKSMPK